MTILKKLWVPLLFVAMTCVFFYRAVFSELIFISRDIQRVYYPLRRYWADRVLAGGFPDWYPYDGLGQPYVGMVISGAFHPTNLLGLVFPMGLAIKLNILMCYPLAMGGVYLLARRFGLERGPAILSGVLFAFSGYMVGITNNLLYLMAAATFPWALWAADRFYAAPSLLRATGAALAATLVLLAGDSQSFVVCCGLVVALAMLRATPGSFRRNTMNAGALMTLTAAMSALQWVPALNVLRGGNAANQPLATAQTWSLHPLRLLEVALGPIFRGELSPRSFAALSKHLLQEDMPALWVDSLYLGAPALALGAVALVIHRHNRRVLMAAVGGLFLSVLALGKHAALYSLLYYLLPPWRAFRYPEKLIPYLLLFAAVAAGAGLQHALARPSSRKRVAWLLACVGAAFLILAGLEATFFPVQKHLLGFFWQGTPDPAALSIVSKSLQRFSAYAAVSAALLAATIAWARSQRLATTLAVAISAGSLFVSNEPLYELTFPEVLETPSSFVQIIREQEGPARLGGYRVGSGVDGHILPRLKGMSLVDRYAASSATALEADTQAYWGLESLNAYLPATSARYSDLSHHGKTFWFRHAGLMSGRYITVAADTYAKIGGSTTVILSEHSTLALLLLRNPTALPRAYFTYPRCAPGPAGVQALLRSRDFDPTREALVECASAEPAAPSSEAPGSVEILSYEPEEVRLRVDARQDGLLVLTDAFYPGWTTTVDGEPNTIIPTNHVFRGLRLEAGPHEVVFRYRTPGARGAALLSALTLIVGLLCGMWCRSRAPR